MSSDKRLNLSNYRMENVMDTLNAGSFAKEQFNVAEQIIKEVQDYLMNRAI